MKENIGIKTLRLVKIKIRNMSVWHVRRKIKMGLQLMIMPMKIRENISREIMKGLEIIDQRSK